MLELPNTANTLVRAPESEETVARAISRDLSWERAPNRHITDDAIRVEREYRWSERAKIAENLVISGIRFEGSLPYEDVEKLTAIASPADYGERKRGESLGKNWIIEHSEISVELQSPFGPTFKLLLAE
jgi:hypothetical protein